MSTEASDDSLRNAANALFFSTKVLSRQRFQEKMVFFFPPVFISLLSTSLTLKSGRSFLWTRAACQHKWQWEWAGGQSPPLTIKREKQSKEAININKLLTIIDLLAVCWWAMIVMDPNSCTRLINIFFFVAVTDYCVCLVLKTSTDSEKQRRICVEQDALEAAPQLSSASCSLITHCKADCYFHQLDPVWAKSANFPLVHTRPVQKKYRVGASSLLLSSPSPWDSGLLSRLKHPASDGHEDGRPGNGGAMRIRWYYAAFFFSFRWRLMVAVHGSESRPPLICQSQPKSIHLQHSTATLRGDELSGGGFQHSNQ